MHILLTGASSGIGRAAAELLHSRSHIIYGVSRQLESLPAGIHPIEADLAKPEDIENIFNYLPKFDALVNCAGIAYLSPISSGDPAQWQTMWQVNVHALALLCQLSLPRLTDTGIILNVSSMSGWRVPPSGGFYAPTKFAVRAITEALRHELRAGGSRIRVGTISPGFVDTPLLDNYFHGREEQLAAQRENNIMLTAEDVARSIIHIIESPEHLEIGDIQMRSSGQRA